MTETIEQLAGQLHDARRAQNAAERQAAAYVRAFTSLRCTAELWERMALEFESVALNGGQVFAGRDPETGDTTWASDPAAINALAALLRDKAREVNSYLDWTPS